MVRARIVAPDGGCGVGEFPTSRRTPAPRTEYPQVSQRRSTGAKWPAEGLAARGTDFSFRFERKSELHRPAAFVFLAEPALPLHSSPVSGRSSSPRSRILDFAAALCPSKTIFGTTRRTNAGKSFSGQETSAMKLDRAPNAPVHSRGQAGRDAALAAASRRPAKSAMQRGGSKPERSACLSREIIIKQL